MADDDIWTPVPRKQAIAMWTALCLGTVFDIAVIYLVFFR
jgi:hypothetical protein